ncbi:MAG: hypothetical protein QOF51_863 [Chloroflexota bacterium]|jgi:hypothetical protein|nr:hypothetical protein [Chloroflexota bacterium]
MQRRTFLTYLAGLTGGVALAGRAPLLLRAQTESPANPVQLGPGASLGGRRPFPDDNPWNTDVSRAPVDPNSAALIASIGLNTGLHPDFGTVYEGAPNGIPYVVVAGDQPLVPISSFEYGDESDPGPYPIPPDAPIEGGSSSDGDRHVLVIDRDNWRLYELYAAYPGNGGASWRADSGAIFDLNTNDLRPAGWTSADAAGLPIFPGLVRYDEAVGQGAIRHALRFTARRSRRAYVPPARHFASRLTDPNVPPMGMRVRLRADFDTSPFRPAVRAILDALKTYGMLLADNGSDWFVSGAPDPRWNDDDLATLSRVRGRDFEVVQMDGLVAG